MKIPKIIHQTWKTKHLPKTFKTRSWQRFQKQVQTLHPDWEYRFWTDEDNEQFVKSHFPALYSQYINYPKNIMRADVFRYAIMYETGGLYLDMDYEMLKPFDFEEAEIVLPFEANIACGDTEDVLGNFIFASIPGHPLWKNIIDDLIANPPLIHDYMDIVAATGPRLVTRIYNLNKYDNVTTCDRTLFNPLKNRQLKNYMQAIKDSGAYGVHHTAGTWIDKWSLAYMKSKKKKIATKLKNIFKKEHY